MLPINQLQRFNADFTEVRGLLGDDSYMADAVTDMMTRAGNAYRVLDGVLDCVQAADTLGPEGPDGYPVEKAAMMALNLFLDSPTLYLFDDLCDISNEYGIDLQELETTFTEVYEKLVAKQSGYLDRMIRAELRIAH